jgi:hypothetical protein
MKNRRLLLNLALFLPILLLLGWWVGIQVYLLSLPQPPWVMAARIGISGTDLSGAALGGSSPADPAAANDVIPQRRAALIAWQMLRTSARHSVTLNEGPTLMVVTYPDGQTRLSWRAIALTSLSPDGLSATAAAAYLNAADGVPLAVMSDIRVETDALSAMLVPAESSIWVMLMRNAPLILLGLYVILTALVLMAASLIRRLTQPQKPAIEHASRVKKEPGKP